MALPNEQTHVADSFYNRNLRDDIYFWGKKYRGNLVFTSGILLIGVGAALVFGVGGSAGIAGLLLVLLAGFLLCGKMAFPEGADEGKRAHPR